MKVLQINKYYYPKGGAETVFFNTIDLLRRNGHEVVPFTLKHDKNLKSEYDRYFVDYPELSESGVFTKIKNIPSFLYNREAARQLEKLILIEKPDVAHIHLMFNSLSVSILPVLAKYNIPTVMTVHDYRLICPAYTMKNGKGDICEKCLHTRAYWQCMVLKCSNGNFLNSTLLALDSYVRRSTYNPINYISKFLFVSNFARGKHIESDYRYESKSTQLYNFTLIDKEGEKNKKNYILYVGRLSKEKGLGSLVEAAKELPHVKFKIIGTGPLTKEIEDSIVGNSNIELLGFKYGEELIDYIQSAKFLLVTSEWYENNPMVIIEAMTLGTPVIGSRIGGIPELIEEGQSGFLFEMKNVEDLKRTIHKALRISDNEYEEMCNFAEQEAKRKFSKDVHYAKLMSVYTSLVSAKQSEN